MIKGLFISLLLVLTIGTTATLNSEASVDAVSEGTQYVGYIPWSKSGAGYWTQSTGYSIYNDFDWKVTRTQYADSYGYYYYYVWFYSQSYWWDGYNAKYTSTNVKNVVMSVNGYATTANRSDLGITFNDTYNASSLTFKIKSSNPTVYISWGSMHAR
jgi:hypothetical protein